jgi:hypothetical protein
VGEIGGSQHGAGRLATRIDRGRNRPIPAHSCRSDRDRGAAVPLRASRPPPQTAAQATDPARL